MWDTTEDVEKNSKARYSCGPLHMDEQRQDDQLEPIYNCSVPMQDIAFRTYRELWTIEKGGWKGSRRSVLTVLHDDDIWFGFFVFLCLTAFMGYLM